MSNLGQKVVVNSDTITQIPQESAFLQFFAVCAVFISLGGSGEYLSIQQEHFAPGHFIACLMIVSMCVWLWINAFAASAKWLTRRGYVSQVFLSFCTVPIPFIVYFANVALTHPFLSDLERLPIFSAGRLRHVVFLLAVEIMIVKFVIPSLTIVRRNERPPEQPSGLISKSVASHEGQDQTIGQEDKAPRVPKPPKSLDAVRPGAKFVEPETAVGEQTMAVNKHQISLATLILIRSEDHYLRCYHNDDEIVFRGKMQELETAGMGYGMRINRSTWICFCAIEDVIVEESGMFVMTRIGRREKVAESRRIAFSNRFDQFQSGRQVPLSAKTG